MDLKQIQKALAAKSLKDLLVGIEDGDISSVNKLSAILTQIPSDERPSYAQKCYSQSKRFLERQDFPRSLQFLNIARSLDPHNHLISTRYDLVRRAVALQQPNNWCVSLHNLQRDLKLFCNKNQCICKSHYQIAKCKGLIDDRFLYRTTVRGLDIYTLGNYYAYLHKGEWSTLLKAIKHPPYRSELLEPMANIMADFIKEKTILLQDIDIIVPVPASTQKFGARGFAPNIIVASRIGACLGVPVREALVRHDGRNTLEASDSELAAQFEVPQSQGKTLAGLSVLLVEDIWTRGRTLPICAEKLRKFQLKSIFAVSLARTFS